MGRSLPSELFEKWAPKQRIYVLDREYFTLSFSKMEKAIFVAFFKGA